MTTNLEHKRQLLSKKYNRTHIEGTTTPPPPQSIWQKGQGVGLGAEKNMALGARFQKLRRGDLLSTGAEFSEGWWGAKFSEEARFLRATMFFCKRVISVATLLLIIHTTMYIIK